jgi:zinc protease
VDSLLGGAPRLEALPNGLRVVMVPWASPGIVAYYSLVRVGSRDEVESGHTGFAHFFEHMMFRGTEAHSGEDYAALLNGVGADGNAYTTNDYTCYTIVAPSSALPLLTELEADRFRNLSYAEPAFRTEAGAVRGEYQVWSSDPSQPMWEALSELAFSRHTYRHTTIGYLADIDAMPGYYDYSRDFFRRFYTPDDVTLIVVGDFDDDALMAMIRERYGSWRGRRARSAVPVEPEPTAGGRRDLTWTGPLSPQMYVSWRTPAFVAEGRGRGAAAARTASLRDTAALTLVYLYAFAESSPLYQRLVVNERQLLDLSTGLGEQSRDPGLFMVMTELAEGTGTFDGVLQALQAELDAIGRGEVDAARLGTARSHLFGSLVMSLETPASVAGFLAAHLAVAPELDTVRAYLTALGEVTAEDLTRVAHEHLTETRRFTVTMSPGGES